MTSIVSNKNQTPLTPADAGNQPSSGLSLGSVVFLLIGKNYQRSGDAVIACCATEADAEKIKCRGEMTKNESGRLRYGFDELAIHAWCVGEVKYCVERVSLLSNALLSEPHQSNEQPKPNAKTGE